MNSKISFPAPSLSFDNKKEAKEQQKQLFKVLKPEKLQLEIPQELPTEASESEDCSSEALSLFKQFMQSPVKPSESSRN